MAIDFSKLLNESPEERESARSAAEKTRIEADLADRYARSQARLQFELSEDPVVRTFPSGEMAATFYGHRADGSEFKGIMTSLDHESSDEFHKRVYSVRSSDHIDVEYHNKDRRWKDREGAWRSVTEQVIDVVRRPESLRPELPEGVVEPTSALEIRNREAMRAAARQFGMGS